MINYSIINYTICNDHLFNLAITYEDWFKLEMVN